jgi:5-amino-6-(5-phosphoribosylamino)uracil reductase
MPPADHMSWARARVAAALERGPAERVVALLVSSANLIGAIDGHTAGLSSDADRALLRAWREAADCLLIGARTLEAERYSDGIVAADGRRARLARGLDELPPIVTIDRSGGFDLDSALGAEGHPPLIVYTPKDRARRDPRVRWIELDDASVAGVVSDARKRLGARLIVTEGGPVLLASALEEGLVTDLSLTIAPRSLASGPALFASGDIPPGAELIPTDVIDAYRFVHRTVHR